MTTGGPGTATGPLTGTVTQATGPTGAPKKQMPPREPLKAPGRTTYTGESPTPAADARQTLLEAQEDIRNHPYLVRTIITFTKHNEQGVETKHKDEVIFKIDANAATMPWYVLRNYLVPRFLNEKYGPFEVAWQRIYEIKIIKLINRANPSDITDIPLRVMTLEQLEEYCDKWELNVPVHEFYSVEKAREMVALRQGDEKGYERHLAEYREGKQRQYPELDSMRGEKTAVIGSVDEFVSLEKKVPARPEAKPGNPMVAKKALPPTIPGTGDQPKAVPGNPFAGV